MGKEVVYCSKCGTRIREEDFRSGRAIIVLGRYACAECKESMLASLSPAEREQFEKSQALQQGMTPIPPGKDRPGSSSTKLKPVSGETSGVPAMATPASVQSESQQMKRMSPTPAPGAAPKSPTEPIPKQAPASPPPISRKTPMPRPPRRPGQTSRPYAVASKKKGSSAGLFIGIGILMVIGLIVAIILLSQKH
jgi:hypothetical protein